MTPITLTLEQVKENARRAFNEGSLTAQHPDLTKRSCTNQNTDSEGKIYRCAVAASFPHNWEHMANFGTIEAGVQQGYVIVESPVELAKMVRIQLMHDVWAGFSGRKAIPEAAAEARRSFLFLINHPESQPSLSTLIGYET